MFFLPQNSKKAESELCVNLLTMMSAFSVHGTHLEPEFGSHCYSSHCKNIFLLFNGIGILPITLWQNIL